MKHKLLTLMLACSLTAGSLSGCSGAQAPKSGAASEVTSAADSGAAADTAGPAASGTDTNTADDTTGPAVSGTDTNTTGQETADSSVGTASADQETGAVTFETQDMDGNTITSDIFSQSRLTMINVWATYCAPCLNEMPDLGALAQEYDKADFQLIGIISDVMAQSDSDTIDYAAKLIDQTGAAYPHLFLNESLYYALLSDVMAVPTTFFFDQDGQLLDTVVGSQDKTAWKEQIDGLLEKQ